MINGASLYVRGRAVALRAGNVAALQDPRRVHWHELDALTQFGFNAYLARLLHELDMFLAQQGPKCPMSLIPRSTQGKYHYRMALDGYGIRCFHPEPFRTKSWLTQKSQFWHCTVCHMTVKQKLHT